MKRPIPVTLTLWLVLALTALNLLRLWTAISWNTVLTEFHPSLSPSLSASIGGLWSLAGCLLAWSIWRQKVWAGKMLLVCGAIYTVAYWIERSLHQYPRPNLIFAVIVNLALVVLIIVTNLFISREAHERQIEDPEIK